VLLRQRHVADEEGRHRVVGDAQLQRAEQPVAGPGALGWDEPGFTLNWDDWRVDRLEHYAEVRHPDAVSVVRRGYFDTRARFSEIASDVYADHPDEPRRVMSELDRNRRALSFRIQKSASSSVTVYAKAEDIVRIERRWVRGGAAPEVNFREYQARGIEGLAAWVEAMNPGSRDRIADVESRLSTLAQSGSIDPAQQWAKLCAILSSSFRNRPDQIEAFLEQLILPGGFHRPSASPLVQRAIIDLETEESSKIDIEFLSCYGAVKIMTEGFASEAIAVTDSNKAGKKLFITRIFDIFS